MNRSELIDLIMKLEPEFKFELIDKFDYTTLISILENLQRDKK